MLDLELITGNLGQVLDESNIDEQTRQLVSEAYDEAVKELNVKLDFNGLVERTASLIKDYRNANPDAEESDIEVLENLLDYARDLIS